MPITIGGTQAGTLSSSTLTINRPAASQAGDLLVAAVGGYSSTITPGAGWTVIKASTQHSGGSNVYTQWVGWRWWASGETSYTFATSSTYGNGVIVAFRGASPTSPVSGIVASATTTSGATAWTIPSTTSAFSGQVYVGVAGSMGNSPTVSAITATAPLVLAAYGAASQYSSTGIGWQTLGAAGVTGTRTLNGTLGTWGSVAFLLTPLGFDNGSSAVSFGASGEIDGGSPVHFIDGTAAISFNATQPFFARTYLTATVPIVFDTAAHWQPGVKLDTSSDSESGPRIKFAARGTLDVIVPPVTPPSDMVYVKQINVTMPAPTLDSRGRPT